MAWWALLLLVFAAAAGYAAIQACRGIPDGQRRGVSLAPIIPIFPLGFWGAAMLADLVVGPWGMIVVGWLHAALGLVFIGSIVRDLWRLRSFDKAV
jgi:hypothetical protein